MAVAAVGILVLGLAIYQIFYLKKAHSTFDNYYAFRGCTQLLERTDNFGLCKIASGQTIKIVLDNGRWYLDGDLPCGFLCI
jgi:hypothetical protein